LKYRSIRWEHLLRYWNIKYCILALKCLISDKDFGSIGISDNGYNYWSIGISNSRKRIGCPALQIGNTSFVECNKK
jgi:hypothetical protein